MRCAARDLAGRAQFKPVEKGFGGLGFRGLGSYQFLLSGDLFDLHESEMYDCSRHAYRDRVKIVSFQVVPDQWLQTVQHASHAQP